MVLERVGDTILAVLQFRVFALIGLALAVLFALLYVGRYKSLPNFLNFMQLLVSLIGLYVAGIIGAALFLKQPQPVSLGNGQPALAITGIDESTLAMSGLVASIVLIVISFRSLAEFLKKS